MTTTNIMRLAESQVYEFEYTNHRGEDSTRRIIYRDTHFGVVGEFYPTPTFLLHGYDLDRKAYRSFDISKIRHLRYDGKGYQFFPRNPFTPGSSDSESFEINPPKDQD